MQKVLSKTSAGQTQQYIKRMIICCARLECKGSLTFFKNNSQLAMSTNKQNCDYLYKCRKTVWQNPTVTHHERAQWTGHGGDPSTWQVRLSQLANLKKEDGCISRRPGHNENVPRIQQRTGESSQRNEARQRSRGVRIGREVSTLFILRWHGYLCRKSGGYTRRLPERRVRVAEWQIQDQRADIGSVSAF